MTLIVNTCFKKWEEHMITFEIGTNISKIEFFLTRRVHKGTRKDGNVTVGENPGESPYTS